MIGSRSRAIAGLLLIASIVIGTVSDQSAVSRSVRSDNQWILVGDFHVHAWPGDGSLMPLALRDEARRAGLNVIAITNHNQFVASRLVRWLSASAGASIVIPGEEITDPKYHLIAVGIHQMVRPGRPVWEAVADIHSQGGVAIAAHPGHTFSGYDDAALAAIDGTEVAHPETVERYRREYVETFAHARQLNAHVAPIGSSDIHVAPALGQCRTYLFVSERTTAGVLEAIRAGRTVAQDDRGALFGDADLIARVRSASLFGRTDAYRWWRRASLALAWIGLVGLALF